MLRHRLVLGALLIAAMVGAAWLDQWLDGLAAPAWLAELRGTATLPPGLVIFPIVALLSVVSARELSILLRGKGVAARSPMNSVLAGLGLCLSAFVPTIWPGTSGMAAVGAATALVLVGSLAFYSRKQRVEGMMAAAGGALLAFVYLGLMMGFLLLIRREHPVWVLLWVLLVTKSCDIGAYFTGTRIGRHKLIPWLSPGKTREGLAGGVVTSGLVAIGGAWVLARLGSPLGAAWWMVGLMGVAFGLVGQLGDLTASMLKRDAGVKDSGRSLPGFGGVLDVVDSPLLVAPLAFWWLRLVTEHA